MSKLKIFFLLLPFIGVTGWMMYYANFVQNAQEVILPVTGYDPRNLLSGHYIEFNIDWLKADCHQVDWNGSCPTDSFRGVNRYYVPENRAKQIEALINRGDISAEVVFAYQKGKKAIVKDLLFNGQQWQKYLQTKNIK